MCCLLCAGLCTLCLCLRLYVWGACLRVQRTIVYEPEVYHGLLYKPEDLSGYMVAMLYPSGTVVLSRAQVCVCLFMCGP